VLEGYGMTETSTVTTTSTVADHKLGTVGRALPGSELRIAGDGEILVRGPHVFAGYYGKGDSEAIGAVEDGWLHTGDLGSNADDARVEQIKKFFILDHDLSQETGELTPTLKVKRNVINDRYAGDFEALYAS